MINRVFTKIGIFFIRAISHLPFGVLYCFSDILFYLMYYLIGYRKKVVRENLYYAFPEKTEKERKVIEKSFFKQLCDTLVETLKTRTISASEIKKRWHVENPELLDSYYKDKKDVSLLTMHYANWEWSVILPYFVKHHTIGVYRHINDKNLDTFINKGRAKFGITMTPEKLLLRQLIRYDKEKDREPILIWLAADQTPPSYHKNWYTFLNRDAMFFHGPAILSKRFNNAIVLQKINKIKRGYYSVTFELLFDDVSNYSEREIIQKYIDKIEAIIKNDPAYYLWSHKRWKHKRKD